MLDTRLKKVEQAREKDLANLTAFQKVSFHIHVQTGSLSGSVEKNQMSLSYLNKFQRDVNVWFCPQMPRSAKIIDDFLDVKR